MQGRRVELASSRVRLWRRGLNMALRLWVAYALIGILVATAAYGGMYLRRASLKKRNQGYNKKRSK